MGARALTLIILSLKIRTKCYLKTDAFSAGISIQNGPNEFWVLPTHSDSRDLEIIKDDRAVNLPYL